MLNNFTPLRDCLRYWPEFLGEPSFIDSVGIANYTTANTDQQYELTGDIVLFDKIEMPLLFLNGCNISILKSGNYSVLNFHAKVLPNFLLSLNSINFSLSIASEFIVPVEMINGKWEKKVNQLGINEPFSVSIAGYDLEIDLNKGIKFIPNLPLITVDPITISDTGIIILLDNVIPILSDIKLNTFPVFIPINFKGIYVELATIAFPTFWNADTANSTAQIVGKNLLIGTGGISGVLSLETATNGKALFKLGNTASADKHFELGLNAFLIEFKQNAIVRSAISGTLKIPGFKDPNGNLAEINVTAFIGTNGDFLISASEKDGLLHLAIPEVLKLELRQVAVDRLDNRWFLEASAKLTFIAEIPKGSGNKLLEDPIDIRKIRIYEDGSMELEGGGITLSKSVKLDFGAIKLNLDHLSFGSNTATHQNVERQYFFFGFNGNLNTGGGSVNVRGDGVEFHFT